MAAAMLPFFTHIFPAMRSEIDEPEVPSGLAILGSDNTLNQYFMVYFDERGVSRKLDVSLEKNVLTWWRNSPECSQRMTLTISDDGKTIVSKGIMSKNGGAWEPGLELDYTQKKEAIMSRFRSRPHH